LCKIVGQKTSCVLVFSFVTQITQISWKIRRIPFIEAAMLMGDRGKLEMRFNEAKEEGATEEIDQLPPPDVAAIIAMHFSHPSDRPYERLEMYRMRLERGLDAATRQFERLRKLTAGQEISKEQRTESVKKEFVQLVEESQELRSQQRAMERAAAENEAKEASAPDGNPKPAKQMQTEDRAVTIKATSCSTGSPPAARDPSPVTLSGENAAGKMPVVQSPPLTSQRKPGL
jgi:hypothetical protein